MEVNVAPSMVRKLKEVNVVHWTVEDVAGVDPPEIPHVWNSH